MNETRRNVLVGLFVLVGLGALAFLIILFGKAPGWLAPGQTYPLEIHFDSASGIRPDTLVTVWGKDIGRVERVEFVDPAQFNAGVRVTLAIDSQYRIPVGSRAETVEPGLGQGRPPIEIVPSNEREYLRPGASIPGATKKAFEGLLPREIVNTFDKTATQIGEASEALKPVLEDMHAVLQPRTPGEVDRLGGPPGNLSSFVARMDTAAKHWNTVLGDPDTQSQLKQAVANLEQMSADGKAAAADLRTFAGDARTVAGDAKVFVSKAQDTLTRFDGHVERVARTTVDDLEKAGRFLDNLHEVGQQVARGEGTLGRLVRDDRLYEALVFTFRKLGESAEEFYVLVKDWQKGKVRVAF